MVLRAAASPLVCAPTNPVGVFRLAQDTSPCWLPNREHDPLWLFGLTTKPELPQPGFKPLMVGAPSTKCFRLVEFHS